MKTYKYLIGAIILTMSGTVMARSASSCVDLDTTQTGGVNMVNTCNKKLNIHFCVGNSKSSFSCSRRQFGLKTLSPGNSEPISFYKHDGGGRVYWAACVYPETADNWRGGRAKFRCE